MISVHSISFLSKSLFPGVHLNICNRHNKHAKFLWQKNTGRIRVNKD